MYYQNESCCGHPVHHVFQGCCTVGWTPCCIPTREETVSRLKEYLSQLQSEARGVEERIAGLKKG